MKLEINEPCNEDWSKMKISMHSRHCDVCEKSVMDFTQKNRAEIITYLLDNPNDSTCGRMTKDQFDFRHDDIPILIETLRVQRPSNPFLILALVSLSLSACAQEDTKIKTPPPIEHHDIKVGKVAPVLKDTLRTTTGQVPKSDTIDCSVDQGEIELLGDISVEEIVAGGIGIVNDIPQPENKVRQFAEKMPEYPGGIDVMQQFIKSNLTYPKFELKNNIQGNVYVRFVVEKDGSLSHFEILRTVDKSVNFDKEVLRILHLMPKWLPGENKGKNERVYMTLPFQFRIR